MTFGTRLAAKRNEKGLTQTGLGVGLNTGGEDASKSVVYGWEKDQHYPRVDQLVLICERLNCSADYLLFGISSTLPFSPETLARISALEQLEVLRLENVIRAHMGLPQLEVQPQETEGTPQQQTAPASSGTKSEPVATSSTFLDGLIGGKSAAGKSRRVSKPGRGKRA